MTHPSFIFGFKRCFDFVHISNSNFEVITKLKIYDFPTKNISPLISCMDIKSGRWYMHGTAENSNIDDWVLR